MTQLTDIIDISREEWGAAPPKRPHSEVPVDYWTALEVHHAGGPDRRDWPFVKDIQTAMMGGAYSDLWYHLVIDELGNIIEGRGSQFSNSSRSHLTVLVMGNYETGEPASLAALWAIQRIRIALNEQTGATALTWHNERAQTEGYGYSACCGKQLIEQVKVLRDGAFPVDPEQPPVNDPSLVDAVGPLVGPTTVSGYNGYYIVGADGGVFAFGAVPFFGSLPGVVPDHDWTKDQIIGFAPYVDAGGDITGYYLMSRLGAVFAFGEASYKGRVERID